MTIAAHLRMPQPLLGVIFDCDGVMIDSRAANELYYNKILQALGLPPLTAEQESYTYMATVRQSLEYITPPELRPQLPEICQKSVNYQRDIMPMIRLENGFLDFVLWLHEKKIRMAVHTNRSSGMPLILDSFALQSYFDPVLTAAVVKPKPHPQGVEHVLLAWKVGQENLLFIGDSLIDQQTATAAGVPFAAYGNPALDAAVKVDTFTELADHILPLLGKY